jgi:hypothetical protein
MQRCSPNSSRRLQWDPKYSNSVFGQTTSFMRSFPRYITRNLSSRDWLFPPPSLSMKYVVSTHPFRKIPPSLKKVILSN